MRSVVDRNVLLRRIPVDKGPLWQGVLRVQSCTPTPSPLVSFYLISSKEILFWLPSSKDYYSVLKALLLVPMWSLLFIHSGQNFVYISHLSRALHAAPIPSSDHPNNMGLYSYFVNCPNKTHKKMTLSVRHSVCWASILPYSKDIPDLSYRDPLCASCPLADIVTMFV
jgi:hypothetical protein